MLCRQTPRLPTLYWPLTPYYIDILIALSDQCLGAGGNDAHPVSLACRFHVQCHRDPASDWFLPASLLQQPWHCNALSTRSSRPGHRALDTGTPPHYFSKLPLWGTVQEAMQTTPTSETRSQSGIVSERADPISVLQYPCVYDSRQSASCCLTQPPNATATHYSDKLTAIIMITIKIAETRRMSNT